LEDPKDGDHQLEHCSVSYTGITQHNSAVSVRRNRPDRAPKWMVGFGDHFEAEVGLTLQGTEGY